MHLPSYGTSQNPVDVTAQGVHKMGYAEFARLLACSPCIDGIMLVVTARSTRFLEDDRERLLTLARKTTKPVFMWSYTLPTERSVAILSEAGYPLFTNANTCARTMRLMADYRTFRERFIRAAEVRPMEIPHRAAASATLASTGPVLCEWEARTLLAAYGIGGGGGKLAGSREEAEAAARALGGPVVLKVQSAAIPHKTEAGAIALHLATDEVGAAYDRVLAAAMCHAPGAHIQGVLVQPMALPGHEVILGVNRDAQWGLMLMVGLGGVLVEILDDVALAPLPLGPDEARALIAPPQGRETV